MKSKATLLKALLFAIVLNTSLQQVYYVKPNDSSSSSCPKWPCLTMEEYARQTEIYFTSGATFLFLAGNHSVLTTINLVNVSDVTFSKNDSGISSISCTNEITILCENATNLTIEGLTFVLLSKITYNNITVLQVSRSNGVLISNSVFQRINDLNYNIENTDRAIFSTSSIITIVSCLFERNTGNNGGAIYAADKSSITLKNGNTFSRNTVKSSGGAIYANDTYIALIGTLTNNFIHNSAGDYGGAIHCDKCVINITGNNTFHSNSAENFDGGAIAMINGKLTLLDNAEFSNNRAYYGGAIFMSASNGSLSGTMVAFRGNSAINGGGIYNTARSHIITNATHLYFVCNKADEAGGACYISNYSSLTLGRSIENNYFSNNSGHDEGGAIYCELYSILTIMGRAHFNSNYLISKFSFGGAISMDHGMLSISGTASFTNNLAIKGGSMNLYFSNASLTGKDIVFMDNSAELNGGGIYSFMSKLKISGTYFVRNAAQGKGGAICACSFDNTEEIKISSTRFANNTAVCGGGLYVEREKNVKFMSITATGNSVSAVCISESNVTVGGYTRIANNVGKFGGGMHAKNSVISFKHYITFANNTASIGGAVYSSHGTVSYDVKSTIGTLVFTNNRADTDGGALYATSTDIIFKDTVKFKSNSARNGGAMYFKSDATLNLARELISAYNHASEYGGGIFIEDSTDPTQCNMQDVVLSNDEIMEFPYCFMQFNYVDITRLSVQVVSYNDSAGRDGNFLYGGLLDRCQMIVYKSSRKTPKNIIPLDLVTNDGVIHIEMQDFSKKGITSQPYQLCFCDSNQEYVDCTEVRDVEIHRGQKMRLSMVALDQVNTATSALVTTLTRPTARLELQQSIRILPPHCSNITYNIYSVKNNEELVLYPDGPCRDTGLVKAVVNVTLLPCPDAFTQYGEQCVCEERLLQYNAECIINEDIYITRRANSKFWMGALYDNKSYLGLVLYKICPFHYCKTERISIILDNLDVQCDHNHSGVLCGACITNYSLLFGSSQCQICSNTYIALLIPFAAAGILLVVLLSFLRLTVATGMINSVILYANIIQANRSLFFPTSANVFTVFIAWMNLDLGFQTCFYHGMDAYAQTWLQFAFPVYIWILISIIIVTSRYSINLTKLIGSNPIAVLATLLLMSYTKILKIVIEVYSSVELDYPDNKTVRVWLKDANVPYLESKHLLLTVVTSLVLAFLFLPYTLLLLLGHKFYRFTGKKGFLWLNKIKPLLDSYYAPYKKHTRYWTGFLLLVRCVLYIVFSFNSLGATTKSLLAINATFTAIVVISWLSGSVYKNFYANIIEASLYLNLIILSAASLANADTPGLVYVLVGIVFATTIGIIMCHFHFLYTAKLPPWLKLREKINTFFEAMKNLTVKRTTLPPPVNSSANTSSHDQNKLVSKTIIELREPLLDN